MLGTIAIIGLGLIGGSIAHALRHSEQVDSVYGYDSCPQARQLAAELGLATVVDEVEQAVRNADLIVLAVPITAMRSVAETIACCRPPQSVVTDTGSVKTNIVQELESLFGGHFLGGHPMAGSEHSGPKASDPNLFRGALYVLTPTETTTVHARCLTEEMVTLLGAQVINMQKEEHDAKVATVSHLPHLVASVLALTTEKQGNAHQLAAGGWRDMTRVAAGDERLYAPVLYANRQALVEVLDLFSEELSAIRQALLEGQAPLRSRLRQARSFRQLWSRMRGWS